MAELKKNAVNQILFTMVDKVDFSTPETSLASNFTVKRFGVNRGSAATNVSTLSRIVSKVGSGVYRLSLEANACNYDFMFLRIAHASAATQMLAFEMKTLADDDISNYLSNFSNYLSNASDIGSKAYAMLSDTFSTMNSQFAVVSNYLSNASAIKSDIYSMLTANSDILSKVYVQTTVAASGASLIPGMSDILSKVYVQTTSMTSDIISMISTVSQLRVRMNYSTASDLASVIWSQKTVAWANVSALNSTMGYYLAGNSLHSDIASAVWAHAIGNSVAGRVSKIVSLASDAHSAAAQVNSRVLLVQSTLSDIDSAITSRFSDLHSFMSTTGVQLNASMLSDVRSAITAGVPGTVTASDISDIVSAVWKYALVSQTGAGTAASHLQTAGSLAIYNRSMISDVYSLVSDVQSAVAAAATASDVASKVWAAPLSNYTTASTFGSRFNVIATSDALSKAQSSIESHVSGVTATISTSDMSDIASRVWSAKYTAHSVASSFGSLFSDIYSRVVKIQSTSSNANSALISLMGSRISGISDILSKVYVQTTSMTSDIISMISTVSQLRVRMNYSTASDLASVIWNQKATAWANVSALNSTIGYYLTGNSLHSDIASAVWAHAAGNSVPGRVSKILVQTTVAASGASLIPGMSDILSKVYVQTTSMASDIISMLSTVSQLRVRANYSTASDLASLIATTTWGVKWDVHSTASSFGSAFEQLIKKTSYISDISSKTYSMLTGASWLSNLGSVIWNDVSGLSDLASRTASMVWIHTKGASALSLLSQLRVRAAYSTVSDLTSKIAVANWGVKWDVHSTASSFGSAFEVLASRVSALRARAGYSTVSDLQSGIVSAMWAASVSTFKTAAGSFGSRYAKLVTSDALSKAQSDIRSLTSGLTVNAVTASDISDIVSAVWGASISTLKGVAASFGSRYAKITTSDALSKTQSSIESHVSGITATVGASTISDIASAVWAEKWDVHSNVSSIGSAFEVMKSRVSAMRVRMAYSTASALGSDIASAVWYAKWDIHSGASGFGSAFEVMASRVSATRAIAASLASTASTISKIYSQTTSIASDVISMLSTVSQLRVRTNWSTVSDLASKIVSHTWGVTLASNLISRVSDMYSYLSTMNAGVELSANAISDVRSAMEAVLDSQLTDATVLTSGGLKERIRTMSWVLRNKMNVIKANGNTLIYKDDNATTGLSTAAALTSDATSVLRKRMA